jgi:hypothetical protein
MSAIDTIIVRASSATLCMFLVGLASCGPPRPPPPPPAPRPTSCVPTCSLRGPQGGCEPGVNCPLQVQWSDACVSLNPSAFSEDVDFADGTKVTINGSAQGCGFLPCPTPNIRYNNNYNHIFSVAQTFQVKVLVKDNLSGKSCLIPFPVTVDPPK